MHVSIGGSRVRVALSNEFGQSDLSIGAATIGLAATDHSGNATGLVSLSFNGHKAVTIPAGAQVISDPVDLTVQPLGDLSVSIFLPAQTIATVTWHPLGVSTNFIADGDQTGRPALDSAHKVSSWLFLKGIEVTAGPHARALVTLGDSITDGAHSTPDTNSRWPDVLARRLQSNKKTANVSVLNEGISGNRLLHDIAGPNALARFDRDVLSQDGVRYLIVLEGINDIGRTDQPQHPGDPVTTDQILTALQQIIARAHAHGILVFGATLTPFLGAKYASPAGETMRSAENTFIRTSKLFDGVIDFDQTTRDPSNPTVFLPADDSGDHLHPGDAGYKAMGDAIDLKLFEK
ncbi:MAG TPA: SGNH/GDSL hydrolase family protein [Acidobacteriaceae bacterium]|nr:SGNH/GDSL hydrolase family protein [Acidobacteriaceae bacterium]